MCGIAGVLGQPGTPIDQSDLTAMARALAHRGPDATGEWIGDGVGVAHTRLSLIDLSDAGNQPLVFGSDVLVYNGEIYNFRELRNDLERRGRRFVGTSDSEVLLASLQMDGVRRTLESIRGMFAFAFIEGSTGTTYLCRDRYGIKPLVFKRSVGRVVFASEVKAIMAVDSPVLDETLTLFSVRALGDRFQRRTLFSDVEQVAPGSVVEVRGGRVELTWCFSQILDGVDERRYRELDRSSFHDVVVELGGLLERSVARTSVCDADLGVFLSGGVDSSLITAIAARQGVRSLRAFTSDVVGPSSEKAAAEAIAAYLGVDVETEEFHSGDWVGDWVRATWYLETPVITNPSTLPFARVAKRAQWSGFKAVLTGEGADELFLGYPRLASGGLERVAGAPVDFIRRLYRRVPGLLDAVLDERDVRSAEFVRGIAGGFEEDRIDGDAVRRYEFVGSASSATLHARSAAMVQTSLQALLQRNDRMGMLASIESRFPYLDEDVVAFALNLPVRHKLRRSMSVHDPKHPFVVDKAPIRAVAARYLGRDRADRRKSGFPTPGLHAVRVRPGAFSDGWVSRSLSHGRDFDEQIQDWVQPYDVAKLLSVEIFGRLFGDRQARDEVEDFVRRVVVSNR